MFVNSVKVLIYCILEDISSPRSRLTFVLIILDIVVRQTLDNYVLIKTFDLISAVAAFARSSRRPSSASLRLEKRLYLACLR